MATVSSSTAIQSTPNFDRMAELPNYCLALAKLLAEQPFKEQGLIKYKVITLKRFDDARICGIFNRCVSKILPEECCWSISEWGNANKKALDPANLYLGYDLTLWILDKFKMCSFDDLAKTYNEILEKLTTGWVSAIVEDHQDIMHKQDTTEFTLFIKKTNFVEEAVLFRFLADKFSLIEDVICHAEWLKPGRGYVYNDKIYMWIRKSSLEKVIEKFGFKFT